MFMFGYVIYYRKSIISASGWIDLRYMNAEEGRALPVLSEVILTRTVSPDAIVTFKDVGESVDASMLMSTDLISDFLDFAVSLMFLVFLAAGSMEAVYSEEK